ncbi:Uncharacterised protein [Mycolicibacterium aurum]|uniref:Secreted protein n=1 Tax=Mycolicibacterium aurum TaxID=1791 RepID=A0A3S4RXK8_MYCAU|nr:Uncharacterised protein [Mycolicibacterium aurum]
MTLGGVVSCATTARHRTGLFPVTLVVFSGLLVVITLAGVPAARADGIGSDADVHVAQSLGGRELTVTIRRVGPALGPLHVDVVTHRGDGPGTLRLTASAPDATTSSVQVKLGTPGMYSATLSVDRAGPWELIVDDGHTAARIPFLVPVQVIPPWKKASDYGFFAAGALLIVSLAAAMRARRSWMAVVPATGMIVALTVAVTGATLSAYSPPPPQPGRDLDPTRENIRDPYARVAANSQNPMDYSRPPVNMAVSAGQSTLRVNLTDSSTGRPADDLLIHHGALIHLIVVSPAGTMSHVHPVRVSPGRYEATFDTTERGTYAMTAEIARRGGGVQLLRGSVDGQAVAPPPSTTPPSQGEISATVAPAGSPSTIRARFGDTPDLQPWLGMVGHMMVVGPLPDGPDIGKHALTAPIWSHAHAMVPPAPGAAGGQPDESVARYGPEIDFTYSFALPGRYKVWVQTERHYAILTAVTEVEVRQP